jgi:hypothetical protein
MFKDEHQQGTADKLDDHLQCLTNVCAWSVPLEPLPWPVLRKAIVGGLWLTAIERYHTYHATLLERHPGDNGAASSKKSKKS